MYTVEQVANYFIEKGIQDRNLVNPMKLQKLLYYAYGWYLSLSSGERLFDEKIQAWKYGPVIESIYHNVKNYGNDKITLPIETYVVPNGIGSYSFETEVPRINVPKENDDWQFLEKIWEVYSRFDAVVLSRKTHEADTPWDKTAKEYDYNLPKGVNIDDSTIKAYFDKI